MFASLGSKGQEEADCSCCINTRATYDTDFSTTKTFDVQPRATSICERVKRYKELKRVNPLQQNADYVYTRSTRTALHSIAARQSEIAIVF